VGGKSREASEIIGGPAIKPKRITLTLSEFGSVLEEVESVGLTWTADIPPRLIASKPETEGALSSPEIVRLQQTYPHFPLEFGSVVFYALTGKTVSNLAGNKQLLEKKASLIRAKGIITEKFRAEFFFKHAVKVPYFSDLDWEVVFKVYERNVKEPPAISYALLSLEFEAPGRATSGKRRVVVAVDENMVEKLIKDLSEVKLALEKSRSVRRITEEEVVPKDEHDAGAHARDLLESTNTPTS
jgi:hypothetical protein